jgi:hypothetical protein
MSEGCVRVTLATFPYGNIQKCSCGGYYVSFGYVTLRLSHEELKSFTKVLNNVIQRIEESSEEIYPTNGI